MSETLNIFQDELPSWQFLADKHSGKTMYDLKNSSFLTWCKNYNLSYLGWCNNTCFWNPTDSTERAGFMFFDLDLEQDIWIHGFGMTKQEILKKIYSEQAYNQRFPNPGRDQEYSRTPYPAFKARANEIFFQSLFRNIGLTSPVD